MKRPTAQEYADALRHIRVTQKQKKLLIVHYHYWSIHHIAPRCREIFQDAGYKGEGGVTLAYVDLAEKIAQYLNIPLHQYPTTLIVKWIQSENPENSKDCWRYDLHPEVVEALNLLGWIHGDEPTLISLPDEVSESESFREGSVYRVLVNAYERNSKARRECISHYGSSCFVCGFNFGEIFGELGEGFIHVHHLIPLSEIAEDYEVDPIEDLRPICPNCHGMLHRRNPPLTIEELREILQNSQI